MRRKILFHFLAFSILICCEKIFAAGQNKLDSLLRVLPTLAVDSDKVITRIEIARIYLAGENSSRALPQLLNALELAEKTGYHRGVAATYATLGNYYYYHSDFKNTVKYWLAALQVAERMDNKKMIASLTDNLGLVYMDEGMYDKAEEFMKKAFAVRVNSDQKFALAGSNNNLGLLYFKTANERKSGSEKGTLFEKAEKHYTEAMRLRKELSDSVGLAAVYGNLSSLNIAKGNLQKAEALGKISLSMYERMDIPYEVATSLFDLVEVYHKSGRYSEALKLNDRAMKLSIELDAPDFRKSALTNYVLLLQKTGRSAEAVDHALQLIALKDSLFNAENSRQINEMQAVYDVEKKENENKLLAAKNQLQQTEISTHKTSRNYLIGIVGLALLSAIFAVVAYRRSKTQNRKLEIFNAKISIQKNEIEKQKSVVEEKNREILDSIHYAGKIQSAILPSADEFAKYRINGFIFFQPKDIISGDFCWMMRKENYFFYATCDCTGHGVPGALMSMLGASLLNEVVHEKNILEPADVLDLLRIRIINSLKQSGRTGENKDGMDMVLCRLDSVGKELVFSAANNPLWLVRKGELKEFTGDKQPVGISPGAPQQFNQHVISLQKGDQVYTFTDGYADQFGGEKGKKFKYRQLELLLLEHSGKTPEAQRQVVEKRFNEWKGELEQVDDVLLVGLLYSG